MFLFNLNYGTNKLEIMQQFMCNIEEQSRKSVTMSFLKAQHTVDALSIKVPCFTVAAFRGLDKCPDIIH